MYERKYSVSFGEGANDNGVLTYESRNVRVPYFLLLGYLIVLTLNDPHGVIDTT